MVQGYLTRRPQKLGQTFEGVSVIGLYGDIEKYAPALDIVFLCLPPEAEPQDGKDAGISGDHDSRSESHTVNL